MDILPLKTLTEEDTGYFGESLIKLAKLCHNNLPVADNLVITPPDELSKKIPSDLATKLKFCPVVLYKNQFYKDKDKLWESICSEWNKQSLWQEAQGFSTKLLPQIVFLFDNSYPLHICYFDPDLKEIAIQSDQKLEPKVLQEIDELVMKANQKLFIPQVYTLIIKENTPRIVKISPFTQISHTTAQDNVVIHKKVKTNVPSILKIYLNSTSGFNQEYLDGAVIDAEKFPDFDELVLTLEKASKILPKVLLRVTNSIKPEYLKAFLFCQEKKNIANLEVVLSPAATVPEIKNRWLQLNSPENLINLEKYLSEEINGVVINLDLLHESLGAQSHDMQTLLNFLDNPQQVLRKKKIQVLLEGKLVLNQDILDFILENGVTGIILQTTQEIESLPEYIDWSVRRNLAKKLL